MSDSLRETRIAGLTKVYPGFQYEGESLNGIKSGDRVAVALSPNYVQLAVVDFFGSIEEEFHGRKERTNYAYVLRGDGFLRALPSKIMYPGKHVMVMHHGLPRKGLLLELLDNGMIATAVVRLELGTTVEAPIATLQPVT